MDNKYLNDLIEAVRPAKVMYHASSLQNLKILNPSYGTSSHDKTKKAHRVYGSTKKYIAAAFGFAWTDNMGISFGGVNGVYTIKIPKKHINLINKPCSLYAVDPSTFTNKGHMKDEYFSIKKVRVINEVKYKTAKDCILSNGIKIKEKW